MDAQVCAGDDQGDSEALARTNKHTRRNQKATCVVCQLFGSRKKRKVVPKEKTLETVLATSYGGQ